MSSRVTVRRRDFLMVDRGSIDAKCTSVLAKVEASPPGLQPSQWPYDPATNTEDRYLPRHAHITALTVATEARRLGHARKLNEVLEQEGNANEAWFIDLFVREDNKVAIALYESMG